MPVPFRLQRLNPSPMLIPHSASSFSQNFFHVHVDPQPAVMFLEPQLGVLLMRPVLSVPLENHVLSIPFSDLEQDNRLPSRVFPEELASQNLVSSSSMLPIPAGLTTIVRSTTNDRLGYCRCPLLKTSCFLHHRLETLHAIRNPS